MIDIPNPCRVPWNLMRGDDQVRFCGQCKQDVFNLSSLTRAQAEELLARHNTRICVMFYRRADGTVLTKDCGGGLRAAAEKVNRWALAVAIMVVSAAAALLHAAGLKVRDARTLVESPGLLQRWSDFNAAIMGMKARGTSVPLAGALPFPPTTQSGTDDGVCADQ